MARQSSIPELERTRGKPIREILVEMFEQYQTQQRVAAELGVNQSTVNRWLKEQGLHQRVKLVESGRMPQVDGDLRQGEALLPGFDVLEVAS